MTLGVDDGDEGEIIDSNVVTEDFEVTRRRSCLRVNAGGSRVPPDYLVWLSIVYILLLQGGWADLEAMNGKREKLFSILLFL